MNLPLPVTNTKKEYFLQRSLEILPGFLTWMTFILMIVFSIYKPIWVAVFIITFDVYWLIKGLFISIHVARGYSIMKMNIAINWLDRAKGISEDFDKYFNAKEKEYKKFLNDIGQGKNPQLFQISNGNIVRLRSKVSIRKQKKILEAHLKELVEIKNDEKRRKSLLDWQEVEHVIIIPTYKEPLEVLDENIQSLSKTNYPNKKLHIFIGFEERAKWEGDPDLEKKRQTLEKKYGKTFGHFETTVHPFYKHEKPGCGSNETWTAKLAKKHLDKNGIDMSKTVLSSFDSEAYTHKEYFAAVTWHFITSEDRTNRAYQPLPFYSNTIWYAPSYSRIISMSSTFWHMVESVRTERLVTFSNQSHSFKAIHDANYWPVNYVVNDDSVIFWRCYFHYEGNYQTTPVYIPVSQDAVYVGGFWETFKASYKQRRRWSYGIEHFPPMMRAFLKSKKISFYEKFRHIFIILESSHSLATNAIMIAVLGWLPLIVGGSVFNQLVIAQNLPSLTRTLLTISMIFLLLSVYLGYFLVPVRPKNISRWRNVGFIYQWVLAIVMATVLGSIPAIDAQTRLMLGKYMGYDVTPKKRQ